MTDDRKVKTYVLVPRQHRFMLPKYMLDVTYLKFEFEI
jgi:hypothetical protein